MEILISVFSWNEAFARDRLGFIYKYNIETEQIELKELQQQ